MQCLGEIALSVADVNIMDNRDIWFYSRDVGAVCYAFNLFEYQHETVDKFLASQFSWYWTSELRSHDPKSRSPISQRRRWTALETSTASELNSDISYRDEDDYSKYVALMALELGRNFDPHGELESALRSFDQLGEPPICAIVLQLGDWKEQIFVPAHAAEDTRRFLVSIGILRERLEFTTKYRALNLARLEIQVPGIVQCALDSTL